MADEKPLIVVGIGASAGGLGALEEFFKALPPNTGIAFVVIQHLDPSHRSRMAEVIGRHTQMNVVDAAEQMRFAPNTVYVPPSDKYMAIEADSIRLLPISDERIRLPIDFFFRSLAQSKADCAVGVVLSGSGADGTLGVREIRCSGGMVIAQEPATAQFDAMPRNAISTGMVDFVLPPDEMPNALIRFAEHSFRAPMLEIPESDDIAEKVSPILDVIARETKQNFLSYRKSTVYRRIMRRMSIARLTNLNDYLRFLREKPSEVQELAKDLLISVTSFFRDSEAFEDLREKAIIPLLRQKHDRVPLRVWIPGCATGEEAYSIAMLLLEEASAAKRNVPIQIFASDLDEEGLKIARLGLYPESIALDIPGERLERFFTKTDHSYQINKEVRELVTFALQNLVSDPPFSKLDLISCRNLLIYFEPELQRRVIQLFAFGLMPGGYLFLGRSDITGGGALRRQFEFVSSQARIYQRTETAPTFVAPIVPVTIRDGRALPHAVSTARDRRPINCPDLLNRAFLLRFGASGVITDQSGAIIHMAGPLRKYLDFPTGGPELNLFDMVGDQALRRLRPSLHRAIHDEKTVVLERVEFSPDNFRCVSNVTIVPFPGNDQKLAAVLFEQLGEPATEAHVVSRESDSSEEASLIKRLEADLKTVTDDFHMTVSDYEASAEELKAANEEITSINEELHSTNEELETSKEEIQAANEELSTVNSQLSLKIEELARVNDDLSNFLNATDIATLFLDERCNIKRFTPAARNLFNFVTTDVGRPVGDISNRLVDVDLVKICRQTVDQLVRVQREIQSTDGDWYLMRCIPYRTLDNKIDGVVLTFVDITDRRKAELELQSVNISLEQRVADRVGAERLLRQITVSSNEALTIEEVLLPVMEQTCEYMDWALGHAFLIDDSGKLVSSGLWYSSGKNKFEAFRQATEGHHFAAREGSPGRVLASGKPLWISDLRKDLSIVRAKAAHEAGFMATLLIPVLVKREVVAVLEYFGLDRREPDDSLLDITNQVGIQIGRVFERKRAEIKLQENERLAALGVTTAKVAHEINNPLSNIYAAVQFIEGELAQRKEPDDGDMKVMVNDVKGEFERLSRIMNDLRTFLATGSQTLHLEPVNIAELAVEVLRMDTAALKAQIRLIQEISADLPPVRGDRDKLKSVLGNLIRNAIEAMSPPAGATLTLRAYESGDHISLEIGDTGIGIPEDLNILERPTSTKRPGIGLGLLIVRQIIAEHNGTVTYTSTQGQGTTFKITLPVHP